jgi:hypothetical protein
VSTTKIFFLCYNVHADNSTVMYYIHVLDAYMLIQGLFLEFKEPVITMCTMVNILVLELPFITLQIHSPHHKYMYKCFLKFVKTAPEMKSITISNFYISDL